MRRRWRGLGLRGRLAISIATIVVLAFAVVFVAVRAQMAEGSAVSPIEDAQSDVEKTFLAVGAVTLLAALLAGYLLATPTASPSRLASTPSPQREPSCGSWPRPSTTCSTASSRPSPASARSSPMPRTSCVAR